MLLSHPSRFEAFVSEARSYPHLWRLLVGICLAALVYAIWNRALFGAYAWFTDSNSITIAKIGLTPAGVYFLLASFIGLALGVALAAWFMHRRGPGSLFGPTATVIRHFVISTALVGAIQGLVLVIWTTEYNVEPGLVLSTWLLLLPLSLTMVLLQTGAEELAFRGYFQQQLAARFRSPFVWMLFPSLVFGLMHYNPLLTGSGSLWLYLFAAFCFGLMAADLTAQTGSIGAAWGFHFANNTAVLLIVGLKDMIPGLSLFVTPFGFSDPEAEMSFIFALLTLWVAWLLTRLILSR